MILYKEITVNLIIIIFIGVIVYILCIKTFVIMFEIIVLIGVIVVNILCIKTFVIGFEIIVLIGVIVIYIV